MPENSWPANGSDWHGPSRDCPIHDDKPDKAFEDLISVLISGYLVGRHLDPAEYGPDGVIVTAHAQHDDDHDILMLKIGIGQVANTIMTAERDAQAAAEHDGGV